MADNLQGLREKIEALALVSEFSYNKPCHTQAGPGGEEVKAHLSPKETWQARQIDDQDRGGIPGPHPQEVLMEKATYRVTGVGRHAGKFSRDFSDAQRATDFARACVKKAVNPGFGATVKITRTMKALEQGEDVTVTPSGQVTISRHDGRAYAPPGYLIRARRSGLSTDIGRTCNEAMWKDTGWALSLVAQQ